MAERTDGDDARKVTRTRRIRVPGALRRSQDGRRYDTGPATIGPLTPSAERRARGVAPDAPYTEGQGPVAAAQELVPHESANPQRRLAESTDQLAEADKGNLPLAQTDGHADPPADAPDGTAGSIPGPDDARPAEGGDGGDGDGPGGPQETGESGEPDPYREARAQLRRDLEDAEMDTLQSISHLAHLTRASMGLPLDRPRQEVNEESAEMRRRTTERARTAGLESMAAQEARIFDGHFENYTGVAQESTIEIDETTFGEADITPPAINELVQDIDQIILDRILSQTLADNGPGSTLFDGIRARTEAFRAITIYARLLALQAEEEPAGLTEARQRSIQLSDALGEQLQSADREAYEHAHDVAGDLYNAYVQVMFPTREPVPEENTPLNRRPEVYDAILRDLDRYGGASDGQGDPGPGNPGDPSAGDGADGSIPGPDAGTPVDGGDGGGPRLPQEAGESGEPDPYRGAREQLYVDLLDADLYVAEAISDRAHQARALQGFPLDRSREEVADELHETYRRLGIRGTTPETVAASVDESHRFEEYRGRYLETAIAIAHSTGETRDATIINATATNELVHDIDQLILYRILSNELGNNGPDSKLYQGILLGTEVLKWEAMRRLPGDHTDADTRWIELMDQVTAHANDADYRAAYTVSSDLYKAYINRMFPGEGRSEEDTPPEKRLEIYDAILRDLWRFGAESQPPEHPETNNPGEPNSRERAREQLFEELSRRSTPELETLRDRAQLRKISAQITALNRQKKPIPPELGEEYLRLDTEIDDRTREQRQGAFELERFTFEENLSRYSGDADAMAGDIEQFIAEREAQQRTFLTERLAGRRPGTPTFDGVKAQLEVDHAIALAAYLTATGNEGEANIVKIHQQGWWEGTMRLQREDEANDEYIYGQYVATKIFDEYFRIMFPGAEVPTSTDARNGNQRSLTVQSAILADMNIIAPEPAATSEVQPPVERNQDALAVMREKIARYVELEGPESPLIKGTRINLLAIIAGTIELDHLLKGEKLTKRDLMIAANAAQTAIDLTSLTASDRALSELFGDALFTQYYNARYQRGEEQAEEDRQLREDEVFAGETYRTERDTRTRVGRRNDAVRREMLASVGEERVDNLVAYKQRQLVAAQELLAILDEEIS